MLAQAALDASFFMVRFDRLSPSEKRYLRATDGTRQRTASFGRQLDDVLDCKVTSLAPTREALIFKGMIWSPSHGETAFTVPLFDEFMVRVMPGNDWMAAG